MQEGIWRVVDYVVDEIIDSRDGGQPAQEPKQSESHTEVGVKGALDLWNSVIKRTFPLSV